MKKIMLLGDSIRQNYLPRTREVLADAAEVWGPADNGRTVQYTLMNVEYWLKDFPDPDIIQFNNGIWDLTWWNGEGHPLTSLEDYIRDTRRLIARLRRTGAILINAQTTPLHPVRQVKNKSNDEIRAYNEALRALCAEEGVIVNDLHTPVWQDFDRNISEDGCHLSAEGIEVCARQNERLMRPLLARKNVLLLGDSIRINYQEKVRASLEADGAYRVFYPGENGRFAAYTLNSLRHWLPNMPKMDVVHWNNGIWDMERYYNEEKPFTSIPEYLSQLERIVSALRLFYGDGVKIIFATTTPRKDPALTAVYREYNAAAAPMLEKLGVTIDDLHGVIASDIPRYICEDGCHLSEDGKCAAAEAVCGAVRGV